MREREGGSEKMCVCVWWRSLWGGVIEGVYVWIYICLDVFV